MNNLTRLQLIDSDVKGFLNIKGDTKVPLNFSVSDIRDISSRSGMFSKTITLTGDKNNNNILNNYFDVNIVAGTFDVNKRQKVSIVQNGIILRDNCFMRLLKVKKKQSVDTNIDEYVEYEVQVTDELGDFFKEVGNKEVKELDGWSKFKHIYGVDAVVDSFDHTVDDGYKYTLPWISNNQFEMNDLMPGIYAKQIFDRIHSMNGFSYDWVTIADDDIQFDKSILPYAGDKKKLTEEYIESVKVIANSSSAQSHSVIQPNTHTSTQSHTVLNIDDEIKDDNDYYNPTTSIYTSPFIVQVPNSLNYKVLVNWELEVVNPTSFNIAPMYGYNSQGNVLTDTGTGVRVDINVRRGGSILNSKNLTDVNFQVFNSASGDNSGLWGEDLGYIDDDNYVSFRRGVIVSPSSSRKILDGYQEFTLPLNEVSISDALDVTNNLRTRVITAYESWRANNNNVFVPVDVEYKVNIKNIRIEIAPDSQNGLMPGTEINIKDFLPNKMKQSEFLKTIYQKYNLYVEVDKDNPSKLIYTSRDKFYDDGEIKDWTEKLDKKREQELYFIPDITTKKMILSYKDDDKDSLLSSYRGETSKTFGQVDVTFDKENIKGEERKEEVFSPTINMETDFGAILPVLNADFKMNPRILQDGGKLNCQEYSLSESNTKTISTTFYPHLSMFDKPYNPNFSIEYAQSSYYTYNPGLFTQNTLYNLHWRRTLAQINSGKMLKAYFWLTEEDIQSLRMNDKVKINNAYYYINAIIDYDANSNSVTKVELLTVEDDLKLPRIGGGIKDIESIGEVVEGKVRPKVPSVPGGFFTDAISNVIKKRYDENVVVAGPTLLTGNLGMGNTLPKDFRGVIIGDNVQPSQDGIFVGENTEITEGGIKSKSLEVPGLTVSEDGDIDFTGAVNVIGLEQDYLPILDTRYDNEDPLWYFSSFGRKDIKEFKRITAMGLGSIFTSGTYCAVETTTQWRDVSGGYPYQIATNPADGKIAKRYGVSDTTWSNWEEIGTGGGGGSMTITPITYVNLKSLKTNNSLSPGVRYYISDRDIWIDALDSNKLAMECKRHFRIVKDDYYTPHTVFNGVFTANYLGIYGQTMAQGSVPNSVQISDRYYAIWGGRMWLRDTSGADVPGTSNETIAGGWTMMILTNNTYYESKIFDIKYNFDDDIIWEQSDDRGNKIKRRSSSNTYIDITDWGNSEIYNNTSTGIFNNFATPTTKASINENTTYRAIYNNVVGSAIYANTTMGDIHSNIVTGYIYSNDINGSITSNNSTGIQNNKCRSIRNNTNNGFIYSNINIGNIEDNSNNGNIFNNSNNGNIFNNSNSEDITNNSNSGDITNNSNSGNIFNNSNIGNIFNNSNRGNIQYNSNFGNIQDNSSSGSTTLDILNNSNIGVIRGNRSTANIFIQRNTNNGRIGPLTGTQNRTSSISEPEVTK